LDSTGRREVAAADVQGDGAPTRPSRRLDQTAPRLARVVARRHCKGGVGYAASLSVH
jgi:hypothetical protein